MIEQSGLKALFSEHGAWVMIGRTISRYEIVGKLGEGGMGVVYKARDTHLDRFVAIKVLLPEKVADPERKRRFVQEAKAASALDHPNIVTVHDFAESDGHLYIVMQYVAGATLRERLRHGGLPLREALRYGIQIADALARAHSQGIIHRDLKPENVVVTDEGQVKILDFGLAKLTEPPQSVGPYGETVTAGPGYDQTQEGHILGTVAYMSPEQAEGKRVDARSDIFSFGSVFYEMITGQVAFQRDSKISTLAAILREEPEPPSQTVEGLPAEVERLVQRCLRKDPGQRLQYMDDVKILLEQLKEESDSGKQISVLPTTPKRRRLVWAAALAVVLVIAVSAVWLFMSTAQKEEPVLRLVPLTTDPGEEYTPSFSPDGSEVAFSWNGESRDNFDIYRKLIGTGRPLRLTSDPGFDFSPAWSPDGRSIAFLRAPSTGRWSVLQVAPLGAPERTLAEISGSDAHARRMLAWSPDAKWLATSDRDSPDEPFGLYLLSVESGEKRKLTTPPPQSFGDFEPSFSPDGRTLAFVRETGAGSSDVFLLELSEELTATDPPTRLTFYSRYTHTPVWTSDGRELVFSSGDFTSRLWRMSRSGAGEPQLLSFAGEAVVQPAISHGARRLAYTQLLGDSNIWRIEVESLASDANPRTSFISSTREEFNPQFSTDGRRIAFASERSGSMEIWVCDHDGANAVQLTSFGGPQVGTPRWSPDGERIAFDSLAAGDWDIYVISARGGKPVRLTPSPFHDSVASWSRDGQWIYFTSNRSGEHQVWKMPAGGGEAVQVTRSGGYVAFESSDGKSIYYTKSGGDATGLWTSPVSGGEENLVLDSIHARAFAVVEQGIFFIPEPDANDRTSVQFFSFASGKSRAVARLDKPLNLGLAASTDGKTVLYSQWDQLGSDLMLVENFR